MTIKNLSVTLKSVKKKPQTILVKVLLHFKRSKFSSKTGNRQIELSNEKMGNLQQVQVSASANIVIGALR